MEKLFIFAVAMCLSSISYAQSITGDVNEDGVVDISDVNAVINIICGGQKEDHIDEDTIKSDNDFAAKEHEYVDLCLPSGTLWATCNIGADNPEDAGLYFAWGETTGYTSDKKDGRLFNWENYKWCSGHDSQTKYCTCIYYGKVDNMAELEAVDDAATVNWNSNWQMPSREQQEELKSNCDWVWDVTMRGYKVTSKTNAKYIFLPAVGEREKYFIFNVGSEGYYWSRSLYIDNENGAYALIFGINSKNQYGSDRCAGLSVRPVRK